MKRIFPILMVVVLIAVVWLKYGDSSMVNLTEQFRNFDLSDQTPVTSLHGGWFYSVRRGDTLENIAQENGVTTTELSRANSLVGNGLRLGQRLLIPSDEVPAQSRTGQTLKTIINREMLAKLIRAEAEAEPYVGQVAVGAVLLNRVESPKFPNTLAGVIYQPHAFESVSNGTFNKPPTSSCRKAAQAAIQGWDPSGGALFFFNPSKTRSSYIWSRRIIQRIGHHIFSL